MSLQGLNGPGGQFNEKYAKIVLILHFRKKANLRMNFVRCFCEVILRKIAWKSSQVFDWKNTKFHRIWVCSHTLNSISVGLFSIYTGLLSQENMSDGVFYW